MAFGWLPGVVSGLVAARLLTASRFISSGDQTAESTWREKWRPGQRAYLARIRDQFEVAGVIVAPMARWGVGAVDAQRHGAGAPEYQRVLQGLHLAEQVLAGVIGQRADRDVGRGIGHGFLRSAA
jgi:hypothetical protein